MKASSVTSTKVSVTISTQELVDMVRAAGIHVPFGVEVCAYAAPFDEQDGDGILLEWTQEHDAPKQG